MSANFEKLKGLMASVLMLPAQDVNDSLSVHALEAWDSLKHMELIASLESEFGVTLTAEEIVAMTNFPTIKNILSQKGIAL